jgi:hypothetical protein
MPRLEAKTATRSIAVRGPPELSDSTRPTRSVRSAVKHWQPPKGLSSDEVRAVIAAAACERVRLLLRVLWAIGARISEALALRNRPDHSRDGAGGGLPGAGRPTPQLDRLESSVGTQAFAGLLVFPPAPNPYLLLPYLLLWVLLIVYAFRLLIRLAYSLFRFLVALVFGPVAITLWAIPQGG